MNRKNLRFSALASVLVASAGASTVALADWTVVSLQPDGPAWSQAFGVGDGQQAGVANLQPGGQRASLWTGDAASWINLHPADGGGSHTRANAAHGGQQGGWISTGTSTTQSRAALWEGTAESFVLLHPAGAGRSEVLGIHDGQQVGYFNESGTGSSANRAVLWTGSAASMVNLHPAEATGASRANAVHNGQQVGFANISGNRAGFWTGSAASWVNLHPAEATTSQATSVHNGQQGGFANIGGNRASLWTGTAASWINLHPADSMSSVVEGVYDGVQVGHVFGDIGGGVLRERASVWTGSAESWEDLSQILPPGTWGDTRANAVWSDGDTLYVVGYGINMGVSPARNEALLWTKPLTGDCIVDLNGDGVVDADDFFEYLALFADGDPRADFTGDGVIDADDFFLFLSLFADGCP